jgi:hypothetical protein
MAEPTSPLCQLRVFRAELHACLTRRADALFELADALLCAEAMPSLPHLSLEAVHQRGWGSSYAALAQGRLEVGALRDLLARHPLHDGEPIYAVDVSTWPRCDAETSPERGFYYHPSRHSAGQPIVAGWAFQWICQLSFARDSWTAPVDAARLHPTDNHNQAAVTQIRALVARCLLAVSCRCLCSTPATTPARSGWAWPRSARRSWSGYALVAASTPTRHRGLRPARAAGHAATAPNSTPAIRPPGHRRPQPMSRTTASTAP